ncbi:hypothetical protein [Klebsiella pneumoniae]|nr:hypothetical protein [Klebsiella pneumoniae]
MQIQLVKNGVVAIAFRHPVQQQRDTWVETGSVHALAS